jgi:hypothetical protein
VPREEPADLLHSDQVSMPNDGHAIADPLHLGEDVRREKDRPAFGLERVEDSVKRPLHQRVETFSRFVEDRQLGIVLERLDDPDLLAHAARVVPNEPSKRAR